VYRQQVSRECSAFLIKIWQISVKRCTFFQGNAELTTGALHRERNLMMPQSLALAMLSLPGLFSVLRDLALIGVQGITPPLLGMLEISVVE
jgi:hypothetical protein